MYRWIIYYESKQCMSVKLVKSKRSILTLERQRKALIFLCLMWTCICFLGRFSCPYIQLKYIKQCIFDQEAVNTLFNRRFKICIKQCKIFLSVTWLFHCVVSMLLLLNPSFIQILFSLDVKPLIFFLLIACPKLSFYFFSVFYYLYIPLIYSKIVYI